MNVAWADFNDLGKNAELVASYPLQHLQPLDIGDYCIVADHDGDCVTGEVIGHVKDGYVRVRCDMDTWVDYETVFALAQAWAAQTTRAYPAHFSAVVVDPREEQP